MLFSILLPVFLNYIQFLCVVLMLSRLFLTYFGVSIGVIFVQVVMERYYDVASDITRRLYIITNSLILWVLKSFHPVFCNTL